MLPRKELLGPAPRYVNSSLAPVDPALNSPVLNVMLVLMLTDVFFTFSRIPEYLIVKSGIYLPIATPIRVLTLLGAVLIGRLYAGATSKTGIFLLLFTAWLFLATPFSFWRGQSVNVVVRMWLPSYVAFLCVSGLALSMKAVNRALYAIAFSAVVILILSRSFAGGTADRFAMAEGTLGNANDLAMLLLFGLPSMVLFMQLHRRKYSFIKLLLVISIPFILLLVGKTASRLGLLLLLFLAASLFVAAPATGKLKVLLVTGLLGAFFFGMAPTSALARFKTVLPFIGGVNEMDPEMRAMEESAEGSSTIRRNTLTESIVMTIRHPIFGVGPGTFQSVAAENARQQGRRARWLETHNAYTQVSSEAGIPALLFYVGALVTCIGSVRSIRKRTKKVPELDRLAKTSFCILMVLGVYVISAFFGSIAYLPFFPMVAAIADSFRRVASKEIQDFENTQAKSSVAGRRPRLEMLPVTP